MTQTAAATPLVAIVTPVYNGEAFLAGTMASVQAQTYANIVHLVLENASTDSTPRIIAQFEGGKIPLLVARNETLLPMIANWNRASELIPEQAAYFIYLCADDTLQPDAIARMVAAAQSDPAVMAVTAAVKANDQIVDFGWPRDQAVFDGRDVLRYVFTQLPPLDARIALFRRTVLDLARPFFDPTLQASEDMEALMRAIAGAKMGFVHEPIAMVREHAGNASNQTTRPLKLQFLDHVLVLRRYADLVFGARDGADMRQDFRRYHLRRLLTWRWLQGNRKAYDLHVRWLAANDRAPNLPDYLDAFFDLAVKKCGLRPQRYIYPG